MTLADIEGDEVMGWPSRRRIDARGVIKTRSGKVVTAQTPIFEQEGLLTPTKAWYIVQHLKIPEAIHPAEWSLTIDGAVNKSLSLSFDDLQALPGRTVRTMQECSGSDAEYFHEMEGEPAKERAKRRADGMILAAAEYTGVPMKAVLEAAGVDPAAVQVRMEGADTGKPHDDPEWEEIVYDKAIPVEKALDPDTLLAWAMNGEYLDHIHGAPLRVVVPGYSGNWQIKWLQRLEVTTEPSPCYYQTRYYVYGPSLEEAEDIVSLMPAKAMVTFPKPEGATVPSGRHVIRGLAWSGFAPVSRVEVSVDGGASWQDAHLEEPVERWLWARWSLAHEFDTAGEYVIQSRATDAAGNVQGTNPRYEDRGHNFQLKNYAGIIPTTLTVT